MGPRLITFHMKQGCASELLLLGWGSLENIGDNSWSQDQRVIQERLNNDIRVTSYNSFGFNSFIKELETLIYH